jgi:hypothetical protein
MENFFDKIKLLIATITVISIYTFAYVTPLYAVFYLIIVRNLELSMEISIRFYLIAYLISFVINFRNLKNLVEK